MKKKWKITWRRKNNPLCGRNCPFRDDDPIDNEKDKCVLGFGVWDDEEQDLKPVTCPGPLPPKKSYKLTEVDDV